ncbi:S-layer homology domain-containing protein [Paenibacillus glycanilyticus]|uniref:S-layer homology domain-containing protein n=1 Tax=Paenibacillus glycanilyticus TaxID=126569 RepID=UPI00203DC99D|nr:S-layer homology domain-containing protein [Paenibacillus glycanilyticus]MCM3631629.1 S-layer homology domain-containing protein [Paenibacillus glycanilyticus]
MKNSLKMIALSTTTAALLFGFAGQNITSAASLKGTAKEQNAAQTAALLQNNLFAGTSGAQLEQLLHSFGLDLNSLLNTQYSNNNAWYTNLLAGFNNPHHQMTREQFTYKLVTAMEAQGKLPLIKPVVTKFKDQDKVSPQYAAAIQRALSYKIIKLDAHGKFNPKASISKADAQSAVGNAQNYLKTHSSPVNQGKKITGEQAVQLIKELVGPEASLQIKIDPKAAVTRESFTYLLVHTLQTSGQLPMIKVVPVNVKDASAIDASKSGAIQMALSLGFLTLDKNGKFNPKASLSLEDASNITARAKAYLNSHGLTPNDQTSIKPEQAAQLIKQVVGSSLQIKIDTNSIVTRESFTYLLVHTLQTSGQLPMINVVPVDVKDASAMDVSKSGAIQMALALGFISLDQAGNFNPNAQLSVAEAKEIADKATAYLKNHQVPTDDRTAITAEQAVQLIKQAAGSNLQIKINPEAVVNRQSFTYLLIHTLQSSGQLPNFNLIPVEVKDGSNIDILNQGAIQTALALNIVQLDEQGMFNPNGALPLEDAQAMVNRAIEVVKKFSNPKA